MLVWTHLKVAMCSHAARMHNTLRDLLPVELHIRPENDKIGLPKRSWKDNQWLLSSVSVAPVATGTSANSFFLHTSHIELSKPI
jgi:hypothetical protein